MGVPKFYRWISERYPCLSEVIREFQIPVFDNLYLDMNGIVHQCSHPEDDNPHFRIQEEDIFIHIFQYIEFIFQMIKPCKVFFMAIDGVAPRAKMNQQRGRRFRSAREAENLMQQAKERGEVLPTEKRFDSNCITPGTEFMVRLQTQLQLFVTQKVSTDPLWKGVDVYLSGHETPGEGEHKIMDYIRSLRSKPDYDPNTRHCVYGLDADLILLGLTSHEPHFSLLREEVRFGGRRDKTKRPMTPKETTFLLLHLSLMREYLYFEFADLEHKLSFPFDLERIIDDWIFMSFLVGNDFIPHLPHLHIHQDGLPFLWQTYMQVLPTCDGYLTDGGSLNLERFEKYITALSKIDFEKFQETTANIKWLAAKSTRGRPTRPKELNESSSHKNKAKYRELEEFSVTDNQGECLMDNFDMKGGSKASEAVNNCDQTEEESFWEYKKDYYKSKLKYEEVTDEVLQEQAYIYVSALQWNLYYYFDGCQSWSWYYPHHYAPFMSDLTNIKDIKIKLDMGRPFLPFQQLMAVLPSASKDLLPLPLQDLMIKQASPIQKYYPEDFDTDLNGKLHEWEAVVLIPFINETELLDAMAMAEDKLSPSEKARNRHSPHQLYQYSSECLGKYPSTLSKIPDVHYNHALCTYVPLDAFHTPVNMLKKSLLTNDKQNVYFPGFPTFKHIRHRAELKKDGVKVFQFNSKLDNMIIQIIDDCEQDLKSIATDILGKTLLVSWPHLYEVKVLVVADDQMRYYLSNHFDDAIRSEKFDELQRKLWQREVNAITEKYHSTRGIEIGPTSVLIQASPVTGHKHVTGPGGKITLQKQFSDKTMPYALQASVRDVVTEESEFYVQKSIDEVFTIDSSVFMLSGNYYGFHGKVSQVNKELCTVTVSIPLPYEPNLDNIIRNPQFYEKRYYSAYDAAMRLGISSYFLSHITETVFLMRSSHNGSHEQKVNIGLSLKIHRWNEEAPGYTRYTLGNWQYSEKTLDCVHQYLQKFPELFEIISTQGHSYHIALTETKVFSNLRYTLQNVLDFIKTLPCYKLKLLKSGSTVLNEGVVEAIANVVKQLPDINKNVKTVQQTVKTDQLFKPIASMSNIIPDPDVKYRLFDRIINIRKELGSLPFGLRGTVVGIQPGDKPFSTIYDILFDEEFPKAVEMGNVPNCGYHLTIHDMMNLSHGEHLNRSTITSPFPDRTAQYANQNQSARPTYSGNQTQRKVTVNNQNNSWNTQQTPTTPADQSHHQQGDTFHPNAFYDSVSPQFVTPKMFSRKQAKLTDDKASAKRDKSSGVNEFADIWKELKQLKVTDPPSHASKAGQPASTASSSCSLSHAAQALDKLSDSMTAANSKAEFGSNRDENGNGRLAATAGGGGGGGSRGGSGGGGGGGGNHKNRLTVSSLFQQAVESEPKVFLPTNSTGPDSGPGPTAAVKSKAKGNKMVNPSSMATGNAEEGTAALKQMLNIGNTESAPYKFDSHTGDMKNQSVVSSKVQIPLAPTSRAVNNASSGGASSFTHQVTVEELFEGAKEQILPYPNQQPCYRGGGGQQQTQPLLPQNLPSGQSFNKQPASLLHMQPPRPATTLPKTYAAATAVYKQSQQRQKGPPPGFVKHQNHKNYPSKLGCRNTALELHNLCCHYGLGSPKYDFSGTKNHITACVTLSNGNRLQGTPCATRDEAVESTARIALLHLSAQSMMVPYQLMPPQAPPPGIMPATHHGQIPQQFSSPNSAFSPVVPRGPAPGWSIVPQHLQKLPWYTTQANLNSGGSAAPPVIYPGTAAGNQYATKQPATFSTPLVSTTLTPSQVHTSLSCSVANGSTSNSEKSKSCSQVIKGSHNRNVTGATGKLSNDPNQHPFSAPSSQTDRSHITPATVSRSSLGAYSTLSQKVTTTSKKATTDVSKSSKSKDTTDSNSTTTTAPCINNNLNSTPTKSNHKKKRSRLAANFCTSSSPMAKN